MKARSRSSNSTTAQVAALTNDVAVLFKSVESLRELIKESNESFNAGLSKLTERIGIAERSNGPTWAGISQVALIIATYTVLVSSLVALYVRGELMADQVKDFPEAIAHADRMARIEERVQLQPDFLAQTNPIRF